MSVLGKLTFGALAAAGIYALAKSDSKGKRKPTTKAVAKEPEAVEAVVDVDAQPVVADAVEVEAAKPAATKAKARKPRSKRRTKRAHAA